MRSIQFLFVISAFSLFNSNLFAEYRIWIDVSGKHAVTADLTDLSDDGATVRLKLPDGTSMEIQRDQLFEAGRSYLDARKKIEQEMIEMAEKAFPKTLAVPGNAENLRAALDAAEDGTTIRLQSGIHQISEPLEIKNSVRILGEGGKGSAILESSGNAIFLFSSGKGSGEVILQDLTLRVKSEKNGFTREEFQKSPPEKQQELVRQKRLSSAILAAQNAAVNIWNCDISSNCGNGITAAAPSTTLLLRGCNISECQTAIESVRGANVILQFCDISRNREEGYICTEESKGNTGNCSFRDNDGLGIGVAAGASHEVSYSLIFGNNASGIEILPFGKGVFKNTAVFNNGAINVLVDSETDPSFVDCSFGEAKLFGVHIAFKGKGMFEKCDFLENGVSGMSIAAEGNPTVKNCRFFGNTKSGIWIREKAQGSFQDCEVFANGEHGLSSAAGGNPVVRGCKFHHNQKTGAHVTNKGKGTFEECEYYENKDPGVVVELESEASFRRCKFYKGQTSGAFLGTRGKGIFDACEFFENAHFGIFSVKRGEAIVKECNIFSGKNAGIALEEQSGGLFENCKITENAAGGLSVSKDCDPIVRGCIFKDNQKVGIVLFESAMGRYENNDLSGNVSTPWHVDAKAGEFMRNGNTPNE